MGPLSAVVLAFWALMLFLAPDFGWWGPVKPTAAGWITLIVYALVLLDAFIIGSGRWVRRYYVRGPRRVEDRRTA